MKHYLITMFVLISLSFGGASGFMVNETTENFQISFDAIDDTNMISKMWSGEGELFDEFSEIIPTTNELTNAVMIFSGNTNDQDHRIGGCGILILKSPESANELEKIITENRKEKYVRVFDGSIDGHKAVLLKTGKEPSDPLMNYIAAYWLDEVNGKATKLVNALSNWPEKDAQRMLETIHVEEII